MAYTFVIKNNGAVTLNRPAAGWLADAKLTDSGAALSCGSPAPASLAVGASLTCTSTPYTIRAGDVAAGAVNNTATATGVPANGMPNVTATSSATVPTTTPNPALTIVKSASQTTFKLGDTITYSFAVTNSGNVPITSIKITDTFSTGGTGSITSITCPKRDLAVRESVTCTLNYTPNQADVDLGKLVNAASVKGVPPTGVTPPPDAPSNTVTLTDPPTPGITLLKTVMKITDVNGDKLTDVGDTITWNFKITNSGNVTLTKPANGWVNDDKLPAGSITCPATTLAPGASQLCTSAPYVIGDADVAAGQVKNTATATGTPPPGVTPPVSPPSSTTTITNAPAATIELVKTVSDIAPGGNGDGLAQAGETLTYTFVVTNAGNVDLSAVSISDDAFSALGAAPTITCPNNTLAPTVSMMCTATYLVSQADVDNAVAKDGGWIRNRAHATGTPAGSATPVDSEPARAEIATPTTASVRETKTVSDSAPGGNGDGKAQVGETLTYTFTITNTGSVTLINGTGTDRYTQGGFGTLGRVSCPKRELAPQEAIVCTASYQVVTEDMSVSSLDNTANSRFQDPAGNTVLSNDATATIPTQPKPGISAKKEVSLVTDVNRDGLTNAGDIIEWIIVVANTGDTALTNVRVDDPMLQAAVPVVGVTCPSATLAVGESMTCTTQAYTVTSADEAAGAVINQATAHGIPPNTPEVPSTPTETTTPVTPAAASIAITKTPNVGTYKAGDTITYTFHITNTGNVPLADVTLVDAFTDPIIENPRRPVDGTIGALRCPDRTLGVGAAMDCTGTYIATQSDVDNTKIDNTATVTGTPPSGEKVSASAPATVTSTQTPSLHLDKAIDHSTYVDVNHDGLVDIGDTYRYTFTIINTGNVTAFDVNIDDPMLVALNMPYTCPDISATVTQLNMAPGAVVYCVTDPYTITPTDQAAGAVNNTAHAFGWTGTNFAGADIQSNDSSAHQPVEAPNPQLTLKKFTVSDRFSAGTLFTYWFRVSNTGNVEMNDIVINDSFTTGGSGAKGALICPSTTLEPGGIMDCHMDYTPDQADSDLTKLVNTATATGTPPVNSDGKPGTPITTPPSEVTVTDPPDPKLSMVKNVDYSSWVDTNKNGLRDAGDTITYVFDLTNTGNTTLSNLVVQDPKLAAAGVSITCTAATLLPNASTVCRSTAYTFTGTEEAATNAANTATATGTPPGGTPPVDTPPSTVDVPLVPPAPALSIVKAAKNNNPAMTDSTYVKGDYITYTFTVTNTGNVMMQNLKLVDTFSSGGSNPVGPLSNAPDGAIKCPTDYLAPGSSTVCELTYQTNQADVDVARLTNTATVTGTPMGNTPPVSTTSNPVTLTNTPDPQILLKKTAGTPVDVNTNGITDAGDTITYTFDVTNKGNVSLSNVTITDPMLSAANPVVRITNSCTLTKVDATVVNPVTAPFTLLPGEKLTCTSSPYTFTPTDAASGSVNNSASATGTPSHGTPPTSTSDQVVPVVPVNPKLTLTKTAGAIIDVNNNGKQDVGDTITYTFAIANTGNVAVGSLAIKDSLLDHASPVVSSTGGQCVVTRTAGGTQTVADLTGVVLQPKDSVVCISSPYPLTQTDVDAANVKNTATVEGTPPGGTPIVPPGDETDTPIPPSPSMTLTKVPSQDTFKAGDVITYTFTVTNTGTVTMKDITVTDTFTTGGARGLDDAITCDVTTLKPGAKAVCSAHYTTTQADVDLGTIANAAVGHGTQPPTPTNPTPPPTDTPEVPAKVTNTPAPALTLAKSSKAVTDVNSDGLTDRGDTITWQFTLTNTGNVTLAKLAITDTTLTNLQISPTAGGCVQTVSGAAQPQVAELTGITLAPGDTVVCVSGAYTITADDERAGKAANVATAQGTKPPTPTDPTPPATTTPDVPAEVPVTPQRPKMSVTKTPSQSTFKAGDVITYTFVAKNEGNVTMTNVSVTDVFTSRPGMSLDDAITCDKARLTPGETTTCTAHYTATQADVDRGMITNAATAHGTPPPTPENPTPPPTDSPEVPAKVTDPAAPALSLVKEVATVTDVTSDALTNAGDTIMWKFTLRNTGNVTMDKLVITDDLLAAAHVTPDAGGCVLTKADGTSGGTVALATLKLAPAETVVCTSGAYTITTTDEANKKVYNVATGTGTPPTTPENPTPPGTTTPPTDTTTVVTPQDPKLSLVKSASSDTGKTALVLGDVITYTFTLTNTGNVVLDQLRVTDVWTSGGTGTMTPISCPAGPLAVGAQVRCTAKYTVVQPDVDLGVITNLATGHGTPPGKPEVPSNESPGAFPGVANPKLALLKKAGTPVDITNDGLVNAGDQMTFTFVLTNTGNVSLAKLTITDAMLAAAGVVITCPTTPLAPQASVECRSGTYTISAADEAAGVVANTAIGHGTPPGVNPPPVDTPPSSTTTIVVPDTPKLALVKSAVNATHPELAAAKEGDKLQYTFTLTNVGNVPLNKPATGWITDDKLGLGTSYTCTTAAGLPAPTTLAVGATITCVGDVTYTVTAADAANGKVVNTATAHGVPPTPTDGSVPPPEVTSPPATHTFSTANLGLKKSAHTVTDTNHDGLTDAGDTIVWEFVISNIGGSVVNDLKIDDPTLMRLNVRILPCPKTSLAPGESTTCLSEPYIITAVDQSAGKVYNEATASGTLPPKPGTPPLPPGTPPPSVTTPPSNTTVIVYGPKPALTMIKSVSDASGNQLAEVGEVLTYSFLVTNTGNVNLTKVGITDPMFAAVSCPSTDLAVGKQMTCTAKHTVTADEVDSGQIINTATAHGTPPDGSTPPVVTPPSRVEIPTPQLPAITLVKKGTLADSNGNGTADVGEKITYTFVITNTGSVTLRDISLDDPRLQVAGVTYSWPLRTLAAGESMTVVASEYTVTAADAAAGVVENTATVYGTPPTGPKVPSTSHHQVPATPPHPNPPRSTPPLSQTGVGIAPGFLVAGLLSLLVGLAVLGRRRYLDED